LYLIGDPTDAQELPPAWEKNVRKNCIMNETSIYAIKGEKNYKLKLARCKTLT